MCVIKAELLTFREDFGGYITYVFKNLEAPSIFSKYIMAVRFPNWNCPMIFIGEKGFLEYKEVYAGKDTWWDPETDSRVPYKYDNIIFQNFVAEQDKSDLTVML